MEKAPHLQTQMRGYCFVYALVKNKAPRWATRGRSMVVMRGLAPHHWAVLIIQVNCELSRGDVSPLSMPPHPVINLVAPNEHDHNDDNSPDECAQENHAASFTS